MAKVSFIVLSTHLFPPGGGGGGGREGLPYKSDRGACRIFWKCPLKGTRILFCGHGPKLILTLEVPK